MAVELTFKSVVSYGLLSLIFYWFYKVLDWAWLKPKRYEKILRSQGLKGNPYRLLTGDQQESGAIIKEALSKPIGFEDDLSKRLIPHIRKAVQTHGKNSFMWVGRIPRVLVTDPDLVREVLTKYYKFHKNLHDHDPITRVLLTGVGMLEGEPWAARRKIIKSAFFFEKLKNMLPAFYISTIEMIDKWDKTIPAGGSAEVEVWEDLRVLSGDVTARTLFGEEFKELGGIIYDLLQELNLLTMEVIRSVYIPGWRFLPTKRNNRMRAIDKEIRERVLEIITKKKKQILSGEHTGTDFLSTLLECNLNEIKEFGKNVEMSLEEIIKECKLFFLAGQDTTASLVTWTLVFLCRFPEWQRRAREEVLQIIGDKKPDYDGISHLKTVSLVSPG
ncbi:OLC1v1023369C2 [Oldenlandia corymbosa var. corymbosa]|uniref:OLC1v1023369C2 n=1 Tax=Oldenlandia corymbosa var. corymbosa TaxID=529605 RepID=A0AAV1C2M3_OLDCO|nr:OLC1v1023369C2 [Oldenlandia corymbosa var. corymbosa]